MRCNGVSSATTVTGVTEPPVAQIVDVLRTLANIRREQDALEHRVVALLRASGATWEQIGDELGISRQAAAQRYGKPQKRQRAKG